MNLVLLPGMDGTGTLFGPFIAEIGSRCKVKVARYPRTEPLGYPELEAIARSALPHDGPFVILGESFSGPIAVSLAASCSSRLKGLVLCASFVRNPRPFFAGFRSLAEAFPIELVSIAGLSTFLLGRYATDDLRRDLAHAVARVSPAVIRARLKAVLTVDVTKKLSGLTIPVLYLRASHDRLVPRSAAALVAQANPRTRVVQLDGPHLLLQSAPAEAAQAVDAFVQEVDNAL